MGQTIDKSPEYDTPSHIIFGFCNFSYSMMIVLYDFALYLILKDQIPRFRWLLQNLYCNYRHRCYHCSDHDTICCPKIWIPAFNILGWICWSWATILNSNHSCYLLILSDAMCTRLLSYIASLHWNWWNQKLDLKSIYTHYRSSLINGYHENYLLHRSNCGIPYC